MSPVLMLMALLPVFVVMWYVYHKDKDPEPVNVLAATFGFGCLTVFPVLLVEIFCETSIVLIDMYCVVALAEEFFKLLVVMLYVWRHKDFDDSYDAIVYCVMSSLGFAAIENIMYVFENGMEVAIMRAAASIPGHAAFAVFMGYFVALAKNHSYYKRILKRNVCLIMALLVPIFVHGTYDYLLTDTSLFVFWVIFVLTMDVVAFLLVRSASKNDKALISPNLD